MPDGMGYFSETRVVAGVWRHRRPGQRLAFPTRRGDTARGMKRDAREGSAVWVATVEWRLPVSHDLNWDLCDNVCRMKHLDAVVDYDGGDIYLNGRSVGGEMARTPWAGACALTWPG